MKILEESKKTRINHWLWLLHDHNTVWVHDHSRLNQNSTRMHSHSRLDKNSACWSCDGDQLVHLTIARTVRITRTTLATNVHGTPQRTITEWTMTCLLNDLCVRRTSHMHVNGWHTWLLCELAIVLVDMWSGMELVTNDTLVGLTNRCALHMPHVE
jgi:hypothetical protein